MTNTAQGAIQNATSPTDIAINGDGYFVVQTPTSFNGTTPVFSGVASYTRRGDFQQNSQGYMVNGAGYYLEGIPIDATTGNPSGSIPGSSAIPKQLSAGRANDANYLWRQPSGETDHAFVQRHNVANSELLNPANFTVDPTVAGTGTVVGPTFRHS